MILFTIPFVQSPEFSFEEVIAQASRSLEQGSHGLNPSGIEAVIHKIEEHIGEERFNPTSPYSRFQRGMIVSSGQLAVPPVGTENFNALCFGAQRYGEFHFMKAKINQLARAMQSKEDAVEPVLLEPQYGLVANKQWVEPPEVMLDAMNKGMRKGIIGIMGLLHFNMPGYKEEDWVEAGYEGEYSNGQWVYAGATGIEGVNVVCAYSPESSVGELSLVVLSR